MLRNSNTGLTGTAAIADAQRSDGAAGILDSPRLLTYDAVNGRQLYVNGVAVGPQDAQKAARYPMGFASFALVMGKEVSGDRSWQGRITFVDITPAMSGQAGHAELQRRGGRAITYVILHVSTVTGVVAGHT